ncbi:MAG: Swt1 family HEPN domain-containing protein [Spirochaetaceae bacterium]|nr:Swt1 family HEPN domain-containing protein [Spirochaetaceae bacterium]
MAVTNHERVGKGLELLRAGLGPFVERELKHAVQAGNLTGYRRNEIADDPMFRRPSTEWDVAVVLRLIWDNWRDAFSGTLGRSDRSLVSELRDHRNMWAHQEPFSSDDAYRALDSVQRLLTSISAPQAREIDAHKQELLRVRFQEQARGERRRTVRTVKGGGEVAGLKAWREVVTPHQDVASGRYQQAEFAADLWQVFLGEGTDEYRDPARGDCDHGTFCACYSITSQLTTGARRPMPMKLSRSPRIMPGTARTQTGPAEILPGMFASFTALGTAVSCSGNNTAARNELPALSGTGTLAPCASPTPCTTPHSST